MLERERDRERLHALLKETLDHAPHERDRFVDDACSGDHAMRERLVDLLRAVKEAAEHDSSGRMPGGIGRSSDPAADFGRSELPLTPGQQLGRYEILDLLGAGGMGSVYRALDPSLRREVAIKALAHAFRGDSGSLRRFEREARVLAALSHPNIAAIYGFEWLEGSPYLVLERVEGATLAERLIPGPMPLREAIGVAVQVVEGLEEAHGKGVIHRDLKPSNVMLTPGGRAKLVDFGLAKTSSARADVEPSAEPITAEGAVIGTARYMSPEQVRGEDLDTRTDVWAFGCLLYEMLVGRAAFEGRSVAEVLAAVLRDEPDWSALPVETPPAVRRLLRRCLRREPRARLQHIGDARLELTEADTESLPRADASSAARPKRWVLPWILAAGSLALAAALVVWQAAQPAARRPPMRLSLELPVNVALTTDFASPFAIAPAGSLVVLEAVEAATRRLYIRSLGDLALRTLPGTEGAQQAFFSHDGAWVAFFADRKLAKVAVGGGPVLPLADVGGNPRGATWAADGTIIVAPSQTSGLVRVPDLGGTLTSLTKLDRARGEYSHRWPEALPGGKWVLFTVGLEDASFDEARIEAVSLATGERRTILTGAGFARYLPPGRLAFVRGGRLYVVAFDPDRLVVGGSPEVLVDAVRYDPRNGGCHLSVSASGVIVYTPAVPSSPDRYLAWIDRAGRLQRAVDTPRPFRDPRVSPDGRRIAVVVGASTESDLWVVDDNATFSRLSFGLSPHRPAWTPDGVRIAVGAERAGSWRLLAIAADGAGAPAVLLESPNRLYPNGWSPDGRRLVFQESRPDTGWDLRILEVDASGRPIGTPHAFAATPFHESSASISPDGRFIAYESDEVDAVVQIYVRSFPDGAHKVRVSTGGARWPTWGPAGELFFWNTAQSEIDVARTRNVGGELVVDDIGPVWGRDGKPPADLARMVITVGGARYDVHPSGTRLLTLETAVAGLTPAFTRPVVVLDWAGGRPAGQRLPF